MLIAAANSIAMSLGRHRGVTLIGRPLDVSVQAVLDAQEDIASLCLDADVFYADNKLDKSRVRVTADKVSPGSQEAVIRIRSTTLVDEPVVTFYLRVGCQQKTERRYVILADLASEALPDRSAPAFPLPTLPISPALLTQPATGSPSASLPTAKALRQARKTTAAGAASVPRLMSPEEAASAESLKNSATLSPGTRTKKQDRAATSAGKSGSPNRSRLKLEPLDLSIERDPQLRSSMELLTAPASNPQERSAAVALWQALTAQPQDMLRDAEKLQTLENAVRTLQAQSQRTQLSIVELDAKLQKAQSERYANALVYTLGCLLLLALAGLAYMMRSRLFRGRLAGGDLPWWRKSESQQSLRKAWIDSGLPAESFDSDHESKPKKIVPDISVKTRAAAPDLDLNLAYPDANASQQNANFQSDSVSPLSSRYRPDFALSSTHPSRAVKAEELFDVQQQADFFVSIGQHEQAIEVLRNHIGDGVETSALVYLDLFNLYHQLARKDDYAALRDDFNRRFNTKIPVFEMYTDAGSGAGLEAYQVAMSRIEALWPSPKVLEIIEESIFRQPENNADAFNLEAYRELLMLYSVAKEIISPEPKSMPATRPKKFDLAETEADTEESRPMSFMSTSIQPLSASIDDNRPPHPDVLLEPFRLSTVPPASLSLGLDLDLSEPMSADGAARQDDVSDAEFFAQFDKGRAAALPSPDGAPKSPGKSTDVSDNLIDFDAFDTATGTTDKFKLPKA